MNWIALVAIIGAAAWVPQIIFIIYNILAKPKLQFIPEPTAEIGYSYLGPIFNPVFAIATFRKDALIEKILIEIIHETGEKHEFLWQVLDEKGFEGTSSKGEKVEMRKSQSAIALKIGTVGLVERKIGFQDVSFKEKRITLESLLSEKEEFLKKTDSQHYPDNIFKTEEFCKLEDFIKNSFYWKEGDYTAYLYAYEVSLKRPHIEKYNFKLTKTNAEILGKNIKISQKFIKDVALFKAGIHQIFPPYFWSWVYPSIYRQKSK